MARETMQFRNPAGRAGLLNNFVALLSGLAAFCESRIALAAHESKEALGHVIVLCGCLIGAGAMLSFGYVFLLVSAIFAIAHAAGVSWVWIALATGFLHILLAGVCVGIAVSRIKKPMFESTAAELKKDREWLKNLDKHDLSTS